MERLANWLETNWLVRSLDSLAKLGIIVAVISWGVDFSGRQEERERSKKLVVYQAHEVLALSHFRNSTAAGMALEDLIKAGQDLRGMDLTSVTVINVDLSYADFRGVDFGEARFKDVDLSHADLSGSELASSRFINVDLRGTDLDGAYLEGADLRGVHNLSLPQLALAIVCKNTQLPAFAVGLEVALSPQKEADLRSKYVNNAYINESIGRCRTG